MSPVSLDANKCDSLPTSRSKCIRNTKELSGVLSENTVSAGLELTAWLEPPPTVLAAVVLPVDLVVVVGVLIKSLTGMVGKSLSTVTAEPPDLANAFYVIPTPSSSPASSYLTIAKDPTGYIAPWIPTR
ncbi:hypothetical protein HZH66_011081 [Vespula vulgaris]|uniref:Uncharacterized protein n=1 Tax=Vespula vulgaris TaxID=7454 RepID=A0A834MWW2_VESVU|nr:hypothetical protein HZH66_011081 [Vespula vulgaris]